MTKDKQSAIGVVNKDCKTKHMNLLLAQGRGFAVNIISGLQPNILQVITEKVTEMESAISGAVIHCAMIHWDRA